MRLTILIALILSGYPAATLAEPEAPFADAFCEARGGKREYVLPDRTRVDCVTDSHALEIEFGHKFYEAIGQALWYGLNTNKRAGIALIVRDNNEYRYWIRLNTVIDHFNLPITTWRIGPRP